MNNFLLPESLKRKSKSVKPFVVAIEGPNGVGKSTLCSSLDKVDNFKYKLGVPNEWMRYEMKKRMLFDASWMASAMYFISGIMEVKREIENIEYDSVIMDRSLWSTLAVNWINEETRFIKVMDIMSQVNDFLIIPDLVIILEADYSECKKRISLKRDESKDFDKDIYERNFNKEMKFYKWLSEQFPNVKVVNTNLLTQDQTFNEVKKIIYKEMRGTRDD